ncbi:MAG: serine/threonine-protein kinase, partial [Thermoanaerobaculia bacterium]|nr:serine/threonine-protein kinase [Thermoanaerobaculia bacterium]
MSSIPGDLAEFAASLAERYRIDRELGRGGMGTVLLADDLKHRRQVAIKVMLPELAARIGRDRFLREIEIAARLTHPHILPLYDSGVAADKLYYVTPFIAGETLFERIHREPRLSIDDSLRLAREIASALGYAHHQGVVHRDIKPPNILLADGIALVADFGLARAITSGAVSPTDATAARELTATGVILGTARYMAPEQAAADEVDGRADIYALGCVLYEMLAGKPPFTSKTAAGLLREHMTVEPPPIRQLRPEILESVSVAIAKALAKAPADRPETAAKFAESLFIVREPVSAEVPRNLATPTNVPRQRSHFIGRERELAECGRLLDDTPLLTLTGIGGCGKTRLASKLAESLLERFPDGVWFVDLAPLKDPEHVVLAAASALGIRESPETSLLDSLASHVAPLRTLILLDSCEHVLAASAELTDRLLNAAPELKLIATSREGLGVEGERLFALRSLLVPPAAVTDLHAIESAAAVRLFVDRARVVDPGFALTETTAPVVAEICRRLDGIPLAIELAAVRVRMMSPEQIRSRLDDRFRLLTGGSKTAVPRHQTLRATLQWSYDQLSEDERNLLGQLSVFAGGWSMEAAVSVSGEPDEFEVMDLLSHLVDKSLVVVDKTGTADFRYGLLETVRQFAQERLTESGRADETRGRHCATFLLVAERAYAERIDQEEKWARALEADHDNLRVALEVARHDDPERHLKLAGALA